MSVRKCNMWKMMNCPDPELMLMTATMDASIVLTTYCSVYTLRSNMLIFFIAHCTHNLVTERRDFHLMVTPYALCRLETSSSGLASSMCYRGSPWAKCLVSSRDASQTTWWNLAQLPGEFPTLFASEMSAYTFLALSVRYCIKGY